MGRTSAWLLLLSLSALASGRVCASPEKDAEAPPRPFRLTIDLYQGISEIEGYRRASDGYWAGSGASLPSTVGVQWDAASGHGARLAFGIGEAFTANGLGFRQPAEATWRVPCGQAASLSVGRFWLPFASQEWLYQPANGLLVEWMSGGMDVSASLTLTDERDRPNLHGRVGRQIAEGISAGLSAALGSGVSGGPSHIGGLGMDAVMERGPWRARAEGVVMWDRHGRSLTFGMVRLGYLVARRL